MVRLWYNNEDLWSLEIKEFIDSVTNALITKLNMKYDIYFSLYKYVGEDKTWSGLCTGDNRVSEIELASHYKLECGDECIFTQKQLASNIAHELVHAKQFARDQINSINYVWTHNNRTTDCSGLSYEEQPWEVEAYTYEAILTELYWRQ